MVYVLDAPNSKDFLFVFLQLCTASRGETPQCAQKLQGSTLCMHKIEYTQLMQDFIKPVNHLRHSIQNVRPLTSLPPRSDAQSLFSSSTSRHFCKL
ncbi:hypothetical protein EJ08DRAFT_515869 [Tothia fuscella]|uniref:Uncharacterized protein n=1 Tax=Tothia fuscella TaxID=1048955 RepID=A0A9P4NHU0_9PEZI|nr:hypothetical protein EJ08DRAFT_515869 [Tothia fuscella]